MTSIRITNIRLTELHGLFESEGDFWEERLVRPLDVYPEHKRDPDQHIPKARNADGAHDLSWVFVTIETDEGVSGMAGPIDVPDAFVIDTQIAPFILGADPLASERIWDQLYRYMIHGRKGSPMFALSAIDTALWDLKGKWLGQPLYRLLGGPVQREIPAYASALGFSIEPERAAERARKFVAEGYQATKWFVRFAPDDGEEGARRNVELMRVLREAVGDDVDVMIDAWSSWNVRYTLDMAHRMAEYRPYWIEEPVKSDDIANYARIRAASPVPISGGEHEYTRWGTRDYMKAGAVDIYQADTMWAGGVSEMLKIATICSVYDVSADSTRSLGSGQRPSQRGVAATALPLRRVPGEVERAAAVLLQGSRHAGERHDQSAGWARCWRGDRRIQGDGRARTELARGLTKPASWLKRGSIRTSALG